MRGERKGNKIGRKFTIYLILLDFKGAVCPVFDHVSLRSHIFEYISSLYVFQLIIIGGKKFSLSTAT